MSDFWLWAVLAGILAASVVSALIPHFIKKWKPTACEHWVLQTINGGVFLGTVFLHLLPELGLKFHELEKAFGTQCLPWHCIGALLGFLAVQFLEEIANKTGGHSHGPSEVVEDVEENCNNNNNLDTDDAEGDEIKKNSTWAAVAKGALLLFAISFHSVMEGFALGVQDTDSGLISLGIGLGIHKGVEAFTIGTQISGSSDSPIFVYTSIVVYAIMTPLGAIAGFFLRNASFDPYSKDIIVLLLESVGTGTFIRITFLEILAPLNDGKMGFRKLLVILVSVVAIGILQTVVEH